MTAAKNLPALSTLVPRDWIPKELDSVDSAIDDVLRKLRYRDLVIERSADNVAACYSLTLVTRELALDLLGSGLKLILFPALSSAAPESELAVTAEYRWGILRYVAAFETLSFAGTGRAFFDLFLELADVTEVEFLTAVVECFIDDPAPYQVLLEKLKQWQGGVSPLSTLTLANQPAGYNEIEYIAQQMASANVDVFESVFEAVVEDLSDLDESIGRLLILFERWLGNISLREIARLLTPQFTVGLTRVAMAIEVPR